VEAYIVNKWRGGISPDPYEGAPGSYRFGYGLNIRGEENLLRCQQALKLDSESTVTVQIRAMVSGSDNKLYAFGEGGKVYRKSGSTWALVYTVGGTNAAGTISGAAEYRMKNSGGTPTQYLVYATMTRLHRITLANAAGTWTGNVEEDWKTLNSAARHPMVEAMGSLVIGDRHGLALVDPEAGVASGSSPALSLPYKRFVGSVLSLDQQTYVGTYADYSDDSYIYSWDNIAPSWIRQTSVPDKYVNSMKYYGQGIFLQSGNYGGLMMYDGAKAMPFIDLPGRSGTVYAEAMELHDKLLWMGLSNGTKCGVYSIGQRLGKDPFALALDYITSAETPNSNHNVSNVVVGAIVPHNGSFYVAWENTTAAGVDVIDTANKATGRYESLIYTGESANIKRHHTELRLATRPLPAGCSVGVQVRINGQSWVDLKQVDGRKYHNILGATQAIFRIDNTIASQCAEFEFALTLTPSSNETPEVIEVLNLYEGKR